MFESKYMFKKCVVQVNIERKTADAYPPRAARFPCPGCPVVGTPLRRSGPGQGFYCHPSPR